MLRLLAAKSIVGHAEPAAGILGLSYAAAQVGMHVTTSWRTLDLHVVGELHCVGTH